MPHRAAMKAYFVLNALSLYWAATDLLMVLVFLLPGNTRRFGRGLDQVSRHESRKQLDRCLSVYHSRAMQAFLTSLPAALFEPRCSPQH